MEAAVTAQGETRAGTIAALNEVVAALGGEAGHERTDEEVRDLCVDPETAREQEEELPGILT